MSSQGKTREFSHLVRKFLYVVAIITSLAIAGMIAFSFFGATLMQQALIPRVDYVEPAANPPGIYESAEGWISRPDGRKDDPGNWTPPSLKPQEIPGNVAIFFIHPTSSFNTKLWNEPIDEGVSAAQAGRFVRVQASAFAASGRIWAPRYRQAVFGAFLTDKKEGELAINLAYSDIKSAFDAFIRANPDGPVILAAHSQGSLHLLRLLNEHRDDKALHSRLVATYVVGWPVSVEHDLPALGLPACSGPQQTGCLLSWQSFSKPADTSSVDAVFDRGTGFDGKPRQGSRMVCTNPLTGGAGSTAPAKANLGLLMGDGNAASTMLVSPGNVGATCSKRGYLIIEGAPQMGSFVLPGNNYHVYDYQLFWSNVRADALRRTAAWQPKR